MAVRVDRNAAIDRRQGADAVADAVADAAAIVSSMRAEGLDPQRWGNGPGDRYGWHEHGYHKVLYCLSGSIVFHTREQGDVELSPGDRLEIDPGTEHAATVGPAGVECAEAATP
ncbi:MAG: cupin domain-containing protein [Actinomycetota bacterium]|jgi:quercetin dioxygenase-like cupin family protein